MPASVRKEDKAKQIAFKILESNSLEYTDSFGNKKKYRKKKDSKVEEGKTNRFEEVGYF